MRFLCVLIFSSLVFSFQVRAQTVEKVTGIDAVINLPSSHALSVGDEVRFLDNDLNVAGTGYVSKISASGRKASIKVSSGKVTPGMSIELSLEKKAATPSTPPAVYSRENLSEDDRRVLRIGEISTTSYVVGGILGTYPLGFGIGHAVQGRYSENGWIFTVGELGSGAVAVAGLGDCISSSVNNNHCNGTLLVLGLASFVGFRIWEIVDVWAAPPEINRRYRQLTGQSTSQWKGLILPKEDGFTAGMQFTF